MKSPLFKGSHDTGNLHCEKCRAFTQIGHMTKVGGKYLRLCKPCADKVPQEPVKTKPGKPSTKIEWREE